MHKKQICIICVHVSCLLFKCLSHQLWHHPSLYVHDVCFHPFKQINSNLKCRDLHLRGISSTTVSEDLSAGWLLYSQHLQTIVCLSMCWPCDYFNTCTQATAQCQLGWAPVPPHNPAVSCCRKWLDKCSPSASCSFSQCWLTVRRGIWWVKGTRVYKALLCLCGCSKKNHLKYFSPADG